MQNKVDPEIWLHNNHSYSDIKRNQDEDKRDGVDDMCGIVEGRDMPSRTSFIGCAPHRFEIAPHGGQRVGCPPSCNDPIDAHPP
jgi:hypothetical protein